MKLSWHYDGIVAACTLLLYSANRWLKVFCCLPYQYFFLYHFNDLLAGILFPAYINLWCIVFRIEYRIDSMFKILLYGTLCSLAWEYIAPLVSSKSTADIVDVFMYILGSMIYYILYSIISNHARKKMNQYD